MKNITENPKDYIHTMRSVYAPNVLEILKSIRRAVTACLCDCENFDGLSFYDVHAGHFQACLHHKEIKSYVFGSVNLKYDCSDAIDVTYKLIALWRKNDTEIKKNCLKEFIKEGETWGWD